jgi:hypothetical protein
MEERRRRVTDARGEAERMGEQRRRGREREERAPCRPSSSHDACCCAVCRSRKTRNRRRRQKTGFLSLSSLSSHTHTHTHTHSHTLTLTLTLTHAHSHSLTHTCTLTHMHSTHKHTSLHDRLSLFGRCTLRRPSFPPSLLTVIPPLAKHSPLSPFFPHWLAHGPYSFATSRVIDVPSMTRAAKKTCTSLPLLPAEGM